MKYLIKDGNISPLARWSFVIFCLFIIFIGIKFLNGWAAYTCAVIGLVIGAIGAYSGRAAVFGLRPFGESEWRKAKRSYEEKDPSSPDK
jgi:1,4-dihydroxy-2-naphthoate octaprenyltransferase